MDLEDGGKGTIWAEVAGLNALLASTEDVQHRSGFDSIHESS